MASFDEREKHNSNNTTYEDKNPTTSHVPIFNISPLIKLVCVILIAMHLIMEFAPKNILEIIFIKLAFIPVRFTYIDFLWQDPLASILSPVGHVLLHGNWLHLFSNIGMFLAFGTSLHRLVGPEKLLLISCIGALAGVTAVTSFDPSSSIPLIGASDAISAILGALIYLSWTLANLGISASRPFSSKKQILTFVIIWVGVNFLSILAPAEVVGGRIAWEAHLAGFVAGIISAFFCIKLKCKIK